MKKLSPNQELEWREIQEAQSELYYVPYCGRFNPTSYYFISKNYKRIRATTVNKLVALGLMERTKSESPYLSKYMACIKGQMPENADKGGKVMAKKMCRWYGSACDGEDNNGCPKNTNSCCELIQPKKARVRNIKAWCHPDIATTQNPLVWVAQNKSPVYSVPCTITIAEKYLKGGGK